MTHPDMRLVPVDTGPNFSDSSLPLDMIHAGAEPAFWISQNSQYVRFVRHDSDLVLNAHPLDVIFDGDRSDA